MHPAHPRAGDALWQRIGLSVIRVITGPQWALILLVLLLGVAITGAVAPRWATSAGPTAEAVTDARNTGKENPGLSQEIVMDPRQSRAVRVLLAAVGVTAVVRLLSLWVPGWAVPPRDLATLRSERQNTLQEGDGQVPTSLLTLDGDTRTAWRAVRRASALVGLDLRILNIKEDDLRLGIAQRAGIGRWLPGLFYLGIVLLLLAGVVRHHFGVTSPPWSLTLGETRPLPGDPTLALRLDQVAISPTQGTFESLFTLFRDGDDPASLGQLTLGRTKPKRIVGGDSGDGHVAARLYQRDYGPAARVTAQTADGRRLRIYHLVGAVPPAETFRVAFEGRQSEELLAIPEADLVLRLVYYASLPTQDLDETVHLQILKGQSRALLAEAFMTGRDQLRTLDVMVTVVPEYYVTLQLQREPETPLLLAGGLMCLLGVVALALWPPRHLWIGIERHGENHAACQLLTPHGSESEWLRCIVALLQEDAHA
jgi:hypothetical protein